MGDFKYSCLVTEELLLSEMQKTWVIQVWRDHQEFTFEQAECEKSLRYAREEVK